MAAVQILKFRMAIVTISQSTVFSFLRSFFLPEIAKTQSIMEHPTDANSTMIAA